ncbi:MAG: YafY family protein [Alphaproteobacteria bacterium]|nr:YafY family protein [Alphaproteobacteria bacterium]
MSRASRLLELMQALRRYRRPVRGQVLAEALGVSLRTVYRDIAALQAQGAAIEGEAGIGYLLRPGFTLPPLMFSREESEALALGARWVIANGDPGLTAAARDALAKITAVMPAERQGDVEASPLLVGPSQRPADADTILATLREAIQAERKVHITYRDRDGDPTARVIWPFAVGYFDTSQVVVAWCELRQDFRHFRPDRVAGLEVTAARYPKRRAVLLREWREAEGIDPD